ncbi:hypothetical protein KKH18_04110, partial [bacterium]|nr:hypothetical protein [bacterium]
TATLMMKNRKATIITNGETKIKAEELDFKLDSLIYVHLKSGEYAAIPMPEVNRVIARNPGPYVRNGVIYGAIPGAALGLMFAAFLASVEDKCVDCEPNEPPWELILPAGALIGGAIGGSIGALAGAANTPEYTVEYHLDK